MVAPGANKIVVLIVHYLHQAIPNHHNVNTFHCSPFSIFNYYATELDILSSVDFSFILSRHQRLHLF